MSMDFWQELYKARERASHNLYYEPTLIGLYEDFSKADLMNPEAKIGVEDGKVLLLECPLKVYEVMASEITGEVQSQLNSHLNPGEVYKYVNMRTCAMSDFVNLFECGKSHGKQPDGCIISSDPANSKNYKYGPIIVEVALANQSDPVMLKEGVNWLSGFTDVAYAILLKFELDPVTQELSGVRIMVLRRLLPKFSDKIDDGPMQECLPSDSVGSWSQLSEMKEDDIREQFSVDIMLNMFVDRSSLIVGKRIQFILDADSLQSPRDQNKLSFGHRHIEIELTEPVQQVLVHMFPEGIKYFE